MGRRIRLHDVPHSGVIAMGTSGPRLGQQERQERQERATRRAVTKVRTGAITTL
jgi:hypothetical protein